MDVRYGKMLRRVGKAFYQTYINDVREAVEYDSLIFLIGRVTRERSDLATVEFRIRAMASAVRQGYDF